MVHGKLLSVDNQIYKELPVLVSSVEILKKICSAIEQMNLCEGDFLVEMIKRKGGVVLNGEVVTSYLDMNTIRHSNCCLLTECAKCKTCRNYRSDVHVYSVERVYNFN